MIIRYYLKIILTINNLFKMFIIKRTVFIIVTLIFILIIAIFALIINLIVHISMVISNTTYYGWSTYSKFKNEFNKHKWKHDSVNRYSLFDRQNGGYLHASVIKYRNKGMIIRDPISFVLTQFYIRKFIKIHVPITKGNVVKW